MSRGIYGAKSCLFGAWLDQQQPSKYRENRVWVCTRQSETPSRKSWALRYNLTAMRTALLLVAIVAAIAGNLSGSPDQSSPAHKQGAGQAEPANTSPVTVTIENTQRSEPAETAAPKPPQGNTSAEWALVFVGIVTCLVIIIQVVVSNRATAAMWASLPLQKAAADAALKNAQAIINSERPWVMIQIKESLRDDSVGAFKSLRSFQLSIFNYGQTPAHITRCLGPTIEFYQNPDEQLPTPPDYGTSEWSRRFLAPNDSLSIGDPIAPSDTKMKEIITGAFRGEQTGRGDLVAYGLIEYSDGISEKPYRTAFCYRHEQGALSSMGGHLVLCGPTVYNEYT
jgi:hypothetical protein